MRLLSPCTVYRACIPVVAAVGSVFIEKKTPTRNELLGLFVIVFGVVIAVYEGSDSKASVIGIILCILGKQAPKGSCPSYLGSSFALGHFFITTTPPNVSVGLKSKCLNRDRVQWADDVFNREAYEREAGCAKTHLLHSSSDVHSTAPILLQSRSCGFPGV